jgi:hypothetical protein
VKRGVVCRKRAERSCMPKCCRSKQGMCCRSEELYAEKGQRGVVCRNVVDQSKGCVVDQRICMPKKGREELYAEKGPQINQSSRIGRGEKEDVGA